VNISSAETLRRVYVTLLNYDEELDARFASPLLLPSNEESEVQHPLSLRSDEVPAGLIDGRDMQQITLTGKMSRRTAEQRVMEIWLNSMQQKFLPVKVSIVHLQEYLIPSMK
jgi:hypothetical protein